MAVLATLILLALLTVAGVARFIGSRPAPAVRDASVVARFTDLARPGLEPYLAMQPGGLLLIGDDARQSIRVFAPSGKPVATWGPALAGEDSIASVAGIAVSGADIYAVDPLRKRILHFDPMGQLLGTVSFGSAGTYGAGALAIGRDGNLYLADTGNSRILVLGPGGSIVRMLGAPGSGRGELKQPAALTFGPTGTLYVADIENRRIAWWNASLEPGGEWTTEFSPWGVTVDASGRVYVPDREHQRVHVFSSDGQQLAVLDEPRPSDAEALAPGQAAVEPDGSTLWLLGRNGLVRLSLEAPAAPSAPSIPVAQLGAAGLVLGAALLVWRAGRTLGAKLPRIKPRRLTLPALGGWMLALVLGGVAQAMVVSGGPIEQARPLHVAAFLVALLSALGLPLSMPTRTGAACDCPRRLSRVGIALVVIAVALVAVSVWLTAQRLYAVAPAAWLAGLGLLVVGCVVPLRVAAMPCWSRRQALQVAAVLGIVLVAFLLRFVNLAGLPPEVHGDEAAVGNEARKQLSGQVQDVFGLGWFELPNPSFAISAMFMRVFGNDLFGLRMASVVLGTLTVVLTFLLVRRLFGSRAAVLSAALLSVTEMHVHYSRIGVIYMQAGLVTVLALYLLLRAIDRRRPADYVLLGLSGGLSLVVYAAARVAPVLVVGYLMHAALRDRSFLRRHILGLAGAALAGLLFFAPMIVVYTDHPDAFNIRSDISVLSGPGLQHELGAYGVTSVNDVLRIQAQKTLDGFIYSGESSQQYGHFGEPLLDPWTAVLFVAGVGAFALRLFNPASFLLSAWLWLTLLLGSVMTVDAPFSPHLVGMLPLLSIFPALFLSAGWRAAEERLGPRLAPAVFGVLAAALVALVFVANVHDYLDIHTVRLQPAGFATLLGRYIQEVNDRYTVYLISRPDTFLRYDTTLFLAPNMDAVDLHDGPLEPPPPAPGKGMAFIVEAGMPDAAARLGALRQRFANGREAAHESTRGDILFFSFLVDST